MNTTLTVNSTKLLSIVERIENLEDSKRALAVLYVEAIDRAVTSLGPTTA